MTHIIEALANVLQCKEEGAPLHIITKFKQLLQVCCIRHAPVFD